MVESDYGRASRHLTGHMNRRRFLAGIAATGITARATITSAAATPITTRSGENASMVSHAQAVDTENFLEVPGARLYYTVAGTGPVLLLIPGGPVDAEGWVPIAGPLEEHYTVVRYDPRGISRSERDDPDADVSVETHADDAALLLEAVGGEPAYVLGHSGGAVISLALVERHSELVRTLVAHEPPLVEMLPEDDPRRGAGQEILDAYHKDGAEAAMATFMATSGLEEESAPLSPEAEAVIAEEMERVWPNLDFFFGHYMMPITSYEPDIAALQALSTNVLVGVGEDSVGQETYDTALALAERLGTEPVVFPGDHVGMSTQPEAFVAKLHEVFQAN
jgi:pimeloyl-ACP methyl ester carboxylesterase